MCISYATSDALSAEGRKDMSCIPDQDSSVMKPFVHDFLCESEWSTSSDVDQVPWIHYRSVRKNISQLILSSGDHWCYVFPKELNRVHRIIPVRLSKFMSPHSFFHRAKSPTCCRLDVRWTAEVKTRWPEKVVHSLRYETKLPKWKVRVCLRSR